MTTLTADRLDQEYENVWSQDVVRFARMLLARDLHSTAITKVPVNQESSLLDLAGLGAEVWAGIDPLTYVRSLRDEWEAR
jgi:hypothetical protein